MAVVITNPVISAAKPFQPGFRLPDGIDLNNAIYSDTVSAADGLVAKAGGGQANATVLSGAINRIATVASGSDSVQLPRAIGGNQVQVINDGANTMQVFGAVGSTDTINGTAGSTGVAQNNTTQQFALYISTVPGAWRRVVQAIA